MISVDNQDSKSLLIGHETQSSSLIKNGLLHGLLLLLFWSNLIWVSVVSGTDRDTSM